MFLTYFMLKWADVKQHESDQICTMCGKALMLTEPFTDGKGAEYAGYVCHGDKQVTWVKVDRG